jgi:membrane-associated phospholipid phosphatase
MKFDRLFIRKYLSKLPVRLLVFIVIFCGALYLFAYLVEEVLWEKEEELDESVFHFFDSQLVSDELTRIMETVSYFASSAFLQMAYAVLVIIYLFQKNYRRVLEVAFIGLGGFAINFVMKSTFRRVRPSDPLIEPLHNFSFPSGHATSAFIFYGLVAFLAWKSKLPDAAKAVVVTLLLFFSILIGVSRVYLRVHFPSDVIAGFCIGLAWLVLTLYIFETSKTRIGPKANRK